MATASIEPMCLLRDTNVLGPLRVALRDDAMEQTFVTDSPTGRDDGHRPGSREQEICWSWDGLDTFWEEAGVLVMDRVLAIEPRLGKDARPHQIVLTRTGSGGFFARHLDAQYPDMPNPKVSFVYYLGDESSFTGGDLVFDGVTIRPSDDSLVVFKGSAHYHSVTEVHGENANRLTIGAYFAPPGFQRKGAL